MAAGCPAKCAKFLLIVFNIIFWLSGAALFAVGVWLIVDDGILRYFKIIYTGGDDEWFKYAAYVLIAVGAFTFVTGFAGCCGAIKESPCLLGVYIFLLVIVMLVEITAGVLAFVFRNRLESEIGIQLSKALQNENYTDGMDDKMNILYTGFGTSMNLFQQEFDCCGVNGSADYSVLKDKEVFKDNGFVPFACCEMKDGAEKKKATPQKDDVDLNECPNKTKGCKESLIKFFEKHALILIGMGIGIACLEIFGIIFAVCLCRNPSSDKYE